MGADVHMIIQHRVTDLLGTRWRTVPEGEIPYDLTDGGVHIRWPLWRQRNYEWFGVLAGVRDHTVAPIAPPRGLPLDLGPDDGGLCDESPHRTHLSWVTGRELLDYPWETPGWLGRPLGENTGVHRWLPWVLSLAPSPHDVRLVFGFESV